jgi:hypothetical protein
MRALCVVLVVLASCGGEGDVDDRVWAAYLDSTGFSEEDAPGSRAEVLELSRSNCALEGTALRVFLDRVSAAELDLAVVMAEERCPDKAAQFRVLTGN